MRCGVVMEDASRDSPDMSECDDIDLDTLAAMLDEDGVSEPEDKAVSGPSGSEPSTLSELGLVLSDEEEDHPAPSCTTPVSAFSIAFSQSKFSKALPEKMQSDTTPPIDPLESELREMEARVKLLRENLAKKKKLDSHDSNTFTKLTTTSDESRRTNSRTLSATEELELHKRLKRKSELHSGDTDSEDEEDNRNPMEQRYNSHGRDIKHRIAHESKVQRNVRMEKPLPSKSGSAVDRPGWKDGEGALVSIGRSGNRGGAASSQHTDENVTLDAYSGIRIIKPLVSQEVMRERMEGRRMVRLSTIKLHLRGGEIEGDWATIAVLVAKGNPKDSQKGSKYCIWKLSDLSDCTKTAALFLFGSAYKALWKHSVGTVFGILNPKIMKDKPGDGFSDIISLSIFEPQRVMIMGMSKDLGWCKGKTKMNEPCRSFVNKSSCEFCVYHIQREYQKTAAKRAVIQSSFTRVDPKRRLQERVLGKDQVFYGGQLYTSPSSGPAPKQHRANRAKDLATLNSLKIQMKAEELKAKDKLDIPKHFNERETSAIKHMVQKNEFLGEKLLAPTPGARNLLKHMVKEDTEKKLATGAVRSITAKELLDMTHQNMLSMRRQQEQNLKGKKSLSSSVSLSSLSSASQSPTEPQLARGVKPGEEVDLGISYKQLDAAKAKAVALIQRKGGILSADPNAVKNKDKAVLPEFQSKVQKRLNSSDDDVTDSACKKSKLTEAVKNSKIRSSLGPLDINSDKFKDMMEKKSRHNNLIDVVENQAMEKYYQGLEKREMLEEKLSSVMELSITAYVCIKCKYMSEKASDLCKEENHQLKTVTAKKRFFECKNCKQRTSSLDKLPRKACANCDRSSWCRVPMGKIKKGPKLDSEILSLRGDELKHYSGSSNQVYLHV
ncbi:hypothetical protein O3P69_020181 [Scylla paramamosain]|uniref:Protein MCM10 homolog n=1 Tax=Scylla paramamosain TaxID=85552 RepID=A0AAW0TKW3_SCYPA